MPQREQKGRKSGGSVCVYMRWELLEAVTAAIADQQKGTRHAPLNQSEWIVRAIKRDLAHRDRSRRPRRPPPTAP